ncbi:1,3-beta-glucanosyltransferase gel3 [Purpureocillium lavendulum]|uniref:1,3-beta-glucanosyltransferase n=1 Tax=Purpureocillium lavendulum TaxID=1247861 RepID=A0AB34FKF9_9HYPO|nr:1,3-beta-glucanosyltransferase gel3 [Purpureocillium lavendulum]
MSRSRAVCLCLCPDAMLQTTLAVLSGLAASVAALDPVEVYGNKFFNKDGSQFFIKGVAYQLVPDDPLIDTNQCKLDAGLMKDLGANAIRVYHVDASKDHDGCMKAFDDAGVYVMLDMDTFNTYIEPTMLYWNSSQFEKFSDVMDTFQKYDNLLGLFVGNENIAKRQDSPVAPFIKAAARDMKAYRDRKGYRKIPVGYSAADIQELRPMLQNYLTCGGNSSEIVDFFALNSYSWCDPSTYQQSTYDKLQEYAKNFPVPIFFSETGCNVPGPRKFDDMDAIFGKLMINDWSGAMVYEWIQEENNYGLIQYGPPTKKQNKRADDAVVGGFTRKGTPTPKNPDFNNLKTKWASLHPTGVSKADHDTKSISTRDCPTSTSGGWWQVNGNVKLPTLGETKTGAFESSPSATADPSATATSGSKAGDKTGSTGSGSQSSSGPKATGGSGSNDKQNSADRPLALFGASFAALVLSLAILL